ncbi:imidazolonepropionase, partial [Mesorhizobium sp. M7A.F.Ca.CA.004.08.1.1]
MAGQSKSRAGDLRLWRNARLATMVDGSAGLGVVEHGAVAARDGRIVYAGLESELPPTLAQGAETVDCEGRWITPGLIDCHTHLVHAGNRANEFEMRLAGATYEEVARAGQPHLEFVRAVAGMDQMGV